jgi:hypothetical protein
MTTEISEKMMLWKQVVTWFVFKSFDLIFLHVTVNSVLLFAATDFVDSGEKEAFGRVNTLWRVCRFAEERIYRTLVLVGFPGAVGSIEGDRVLWVQDMS